MGHFLFLHLILPQQQSSIFRGSKQWHNWVTCTFLSSCDPKQTTQVLVRELRYTEWWEHSLHWLMWDESFILAYNKLTLSADVFAFQHNLQPWTSFLSLKTTGVTVINLNVVSPSQTSVSQAQSISVFRLCFMQWPLHRLIPIIVLLFWTSWLKPLLWSIRETC